MLLARSIASFRALPKLTSNTTTRELMSISFRLHEATQLLTSFTLFIFKGPLLLEMMCFLLYKYTSWNHKWEFTQGSETPNARGFIPFRKTRRERCKFYKVLLVQRLTLIRMYVSLSRHREFCCPPIKKTTSKPRRKKAHKASSLCST